MTASEITLQRQVGCARCGGDGHDNITYKPLTHWATCPTTGEPILLRVMQVPTPGRPQ